MGKNGVFITFFLALGLPLVSSAGEWGDNSPKESSSHALNSTSDSSHSAGGALHPTSEDSHPAGGRLNSTSDSSHPAGGELHTTSEDNTSSESQ